MVKHRVVSEKAWIAARKKLLAKEKALTRNRDKLSAARRALPWQAVTKEYVFVGPDGRKHLPELFDGRSQLIVYHFMFGPGWGAGCPHCSPFMFACMSKSRKSGKRHAMKTGVS